MADNQKKMSRREAGQKGGEATLGKHGPRFYSEIGRLGGRSVSKNRKHMSEIGRRGGKARGSQ